MPGDLKRRVSTWVSGTDREVEGAGRRRSWSPLRPYLEGSLVLLAILGAIALVAGFVEAGLIFLVVRTAAALTSGSGHLDVSIGPIDDGWTPGECLAAAGVLVVVLFLLNAVIAVITAQVSGASLNRGRNKTIREFLRAGWEVQSKESPGALQDLLTTNVSRISQGVLALISALTSALSFAALLVSAMLIDAKASLVILVTVVVVGAVLTPLTRMTKRMSREGQRRQRTYAVHVTETVDLAREIDIFGVGDRVTELMKERADAVTRAGFATRILLKLNPALFQCAVMGVLIAGMAVVESNSARVASLGSIVVLMVRGLNYGQGLNASLQQLGEGAPYIEDVQRRREVYRTSPPARGTTTLEQLDHVAFIDVGYEYEPGRPVLADVSFEAGAGEVIGIVGPSGSGKSTLVQVLLRLRTPTSGSVLVNGRNAVEFDTESWSRAVSLVPQDNVLLSGTVAENIRFFRDGIDDERVVRAAELAHIRDEIMAMTDGFDTRIGRGVLDLSGGQRQRLGMARALATDPDLLVLDEPTSALDMQSEALIQDSLRSLKGNLTLFVIAHRLTTLSICDRIMVIEGGRVTAVAPFDELVETSTFFRDAVRLSRLPA